MKCALNDLNRSSISNTVANDQKATKGDPDKERVKKMLALRPPVITRNYKCLILERTEKT